MTPKLNQYIAAGCILVGVLLMLPIGYYGKNVAPPWAFIGVPVGWIGYTVLLRRESLMVSIGGGLLAVCATAIFSTGLGNLVAGRFVPELVVGAPITALSFSRKLFAARAPERKE